MSILSEEGRAVIARRDTLKHLIADSYCRMATNLDSDYRDMQTTKCSAWLDELTSLFEKDPYHFSIHPAQHL